jgi:hypothetical protein
MNTTTTTKLRTILKYSLLDQAEIEAVKNLFYGHQFYDDNAFKNYQAARLAVSSIDRREFYDNLEKMKQGQSFDDVFGMEN